MSSDDKSGVNNDGGGGEEGAPVELVDLGDLDSDVGTIFSDDEERKVLTEDEDTEAIVQDDGDSDGSLSSGSDDDGSEKCPICLQKFTGQEIGSPEMCEHHFCLRCITAWSQKVATCPIDRVFFSTIIVKKECDGKVVRIEEVKFPNAIANDEEFDSNPTYCEICGNCDREDRLLLCDGCDLGYHLECLEPPMEYVPIEDWYCPSCVRQGLNVEVEEEEEQEPVPSTSASSAVEPRREAVQAPTRIPRTLQNERILLALEPFQSARNAVEDVVASCAATYTQNDRAQPLPRSTRKRARSSRKRASKPRRSRADGGGTGRSRRTRRKTRRRRRRVAVDKRPNTARARIAHTLGIMPPLPGQVYVGLPPACKSATTSKPSSSTTASTSSITSLRYSAGITPLRLFGASNDLSDLVDCWSDEEGPVAQAAHASSAIRNGATMKGPAAVVEAAPAASCDVLGGILKKQYILLHDKNIKINRGDGTLVSSISPLHLSDMVSNVTKNVGSSRLPSSNIFPTQQSSQSNFVTMMALGKESSSSSAVHPPSEQSQRQGNTNSHSSGGMHTNVGQSGGDFRSGSSQSGSREETQQSNFDLTQSYMVDLWGHSDSSKQKQIDDDDFDIYSDIEEQPADPEKVEAISNDKDTEVAVAEAPQNACKYSNVSRSCAQNNEQQHHDDQDSDCGMVIDEDEAKSVCASPKKPAAEATVVAAPPVEGLSLPSEFSGSPESIPLPDSPPPDKQAGHSENNSATKVTRKEYDPSEPLDSSEDESSARKVDTEKRVKSNSAQGSPSKRTSPQRRMSNFATKYMPPDDFSHSSSNMPSDEGRRPAIHFSIPKRHNLLPISSLLKRQKGVMKKEMRSSDAPQINFQSEISKAFGPLETDSNGAAKKDEAGPKISLIAEIFGSDEEDLEENFGDVSTKAVNPAEKEGQSESETLLEGQSQDKPPEAAAESVIDVASGRWKTISEEPEPAVQSVKDALAEASPIVSASSVVTEVDSNSEEKSAAVEKKKGCVEPPKNLESEEDLQIIEIVAARRPRNALAHQGVETISDTDDSDIRVLDEVPAVERKQVAKGGEVEPSASQGTSPQKRRDRKRRHSSISSAESFFEEGEIVEQEESTRKKRRRERERERRRKLRKRRVSREKERSGSKGDLRKKKSGDGALGHLGKEDPSRTGTNETDAISWKKPSKTSSGRMHRSGQMESPDKGSHRLRRSRSGSAGSYASLKSSSHHNRRLGHSRSPSHSPEPIRPRSSHVHSRRKMSREEGDGYDRSSHHKKVKRHEVASSRTPPVDIKRKSKYGRSAEAIRKKRSRLKKIEKAALKAKRKAKERLKERKKRVVKDENKVGGGAVKLAKEKGERRRRRREKSLSPVKAIVADGDSIVVSLSFQNQKETPGNARQDAEKSKTASSKEGKGSKKSFGSHYGSESGKLKESESGGGKQYSAQNLDLGTEDLSSTSESSTSIVSRVGKDNETGASSKVSSSGDGGGRMGRYDEDRAFGNVKSDSGKGGKGQDEKGEVQEDSLVTSTRDSLEPSAVTEDEYATAATQNSKSSGESTKPATQSVSSSVISPPLLGSGSNSSSTLGHSSSSSQQQQQQQQQQRSHPSATVTSGSLKSSSGSQGAIPAAAGSQGSAAGSLHHSQGMRYPVVGAPASTSILNPVLATVASALLAVRPAANTLGGMLGDQLRNRVVGMPTAAKPSSSRSQAKRPSQGGGDSPMSPNSSDADDLFEPPTDSGHSKKGSGHGGSSSSKQPVSNLFDTLFGNEPQRQPSKPEMGRDKFRPKSQSQGKPPPRRAQRSEPSASHSHSHSMMINACDINLNEDVPASAVELSVQEKLLKKLNRQERVVEEVKLCLKPHYIKKHIDKEEYKEILRRSVPKICHSKTGEINPMKVREMIEAYVRKFRHNRKKGQ